MVKSYEGDQSSGKIHKLIGLILSLADQKVLIVEDSIDTGMTLQYLLGFVNDQKPKFVKTATLLLRETVFKDKFPIDYYGFSVPEKFAVGYKMDYNEQGRQLKHRYAVKE